MANKKEDLAKSLADELNKHFKNEGHVAYFIGGENTPTDVSDWIGTGSSMLDLAISNKPHGGFPVGRIIELNGLEASGKSLVAAHAIAEVQKKDGVGVYIDTENAMSQEFLEAIGVDLSKMLYLQLDTVEQIFEALESVIDQIRESNKDTPVVIVVDSLAAATTSNEREGDYSKEGWATDKALIVSKAFRKITRKIGKERIVVIFTNQLRQKLGVMFGDPYTTSGGKGLPFHASVRVRLKSMGQIKYKKGSIEKVIGIKARAQVVKNRVGPPFRTADFDIFFDRGIDDSDNWLQILKDDNVVQRSNPGFKIVDQKGEERKFVTDEWSTMLNDDPEFKEFLYQKICDSVIMQYKSKSSIGLSSDDLSVENGEIVDE